MARCLADVIHSHNGTEVYIEKSIPALIRVVNGRVEHARMDLVFDHNGSTTHLDVAIISPFYSNPALIAAASIRPGHMAKRAEKVKFDRYHTSTLFRSRLSWRPRAHAKQVHQQPHERCRQPSTCHTRQLVFHPECPPQRYLQTTTFNSSHVTLDAAKSCLKPLPTLQCGPVVVTRHLTTTYTTPTAPFCSCLPTPRLWASDVDELMVALVCRFALDIFTIAQQDRPHPEPDPWLMTWVRFRVLSCVPAGTHSFQHGWTSRWSLE